MIKHLLTVFLVFMPLWAQASNSVSAQLLNCKAEQDSLKRLMCYDDVVKNLPQVNHDELVNKAKAVKAKPQSNKVVNSHSQKVKSADKPAVVIANAQANFGQEAKVRTQTIDEVRYVIKSATLSLRKKWRFVFENGQQWEQKDTDRFGKYKAGEEVIIKRGIMNAFYLTKTDANRTIRVKRIK